MKKAPQRFRLVEDSEQIKAQPATNPIIKQRRARLFWACVAVIFVFLLGNKMGIISTGHFAPREPLQRATPSVAAKAQNQVVLAPTATAHVAAAIEVALPTVTPVPPLALSGPEATDTPEPVVVQEQEPTPMSLGDVSDPLPVFGSAPNGLPVAEPIAPAVIEQPPVVEAPTAQEADPQCDPSYPDVCIPPVSVAGDLDCKSPQVIGFANFRVLEPDPHKLDREGDGFGCEGN